MKLSNLYLVFILGGLSFDSNFLINLKILSLISVNMYFRLCYLKLWCNRFFNICMLYIYIKVSYQNLIHSKTSLYNSYNGIIHYISWFMVMDSLKLSSCHIESMHTILCWVVPNIMVTIVPFTDKCINISFQIKKISVSKRVF